MAKEVRGDIQGLRAVAVLTVIAAHAGVPFLPGGFVGVDVFYVISGYPHRLPALPRGPAHGSGLDRGVLGPASPADPARGDPRHRRDGAALPGLDEPARRPPGRDRRAVGLGVRGQHPLRPAGRLLLRPGRRPVPAPALLVTGRRGAVLRRVAAAARGVPHRHGVAAQGQEHGPAGGAAAAQRGAHDAGRPHPGVAGLVRLRHRRVAGVGLLLDADPGLGARRRRPGGAGAADVRTPAHATEPRDDGGHRRGAAADRLHRDHRRDAVPGDRGRAAGGRHRAADHVRRRRRRTGPTHAVQQGAGGRPDADGRRLVLLALPLALARLHPAARRARPGHDAVREARRRLRGDHALGVLLPLRRDAVPRRPARAQAGPAAGAGALPGQRAPRGHHRGRRLVVDRLPGRRARRHPADHGGRRADRRAARQHRGAGARVGLRRQGQARGAEQPHPRPAQPARLHRRRRGLRLRGQRAQAVPARRGRRSRWS